MLVGLHKQLLAACVRLNVRLRIDPKFLMKTHRQQGASCTSMTPRT